MNPVELIRQDALGCAWDAAPYLLFSAEVEPLVYYSHLFPAAAVVILAIVIFWRSYQKLTTKLFVVIAALFALFAVFDLILWATENPSLIMFLWSILTYIEPLIYATTLYLVLVFARGSDTNLTEKLIAAVLLLPIILLGPTYLNLSGFDYTNCWRLAVEGPVATYYVYSIEAVFTFWMIVAAIVEYRKERDEKHRKSILYLLIGSLLFLLAFSSGNIFGTLLQGVMGEEAWVIGQYGFFGMPVFLAVVMYLIVRFELFSTRLIYAEAITLGLWVLLLSLLFIPDIQTARPIIAITLFLFAALGYLLIQGVKRDIEQRERIEELAKNLEKANKRLKVLDQMKSEFVSVASHQLRSPLTSIRGYSSMLLEGSFGKLPQKAKEAVERIAESSRYMALSVEDYLNVSRIESGRMKYEMSDFKLKDIVERIVDDVRSTAVKEGLMLTFKSTDMKTDGLVYADIGKIQQIVHNLLDNAMKYTEKGSIKVRLYDNKKKKRAYVEVTDTGVGMDKETIESVFEKFVRARNANEVNVTGTGLGLYVAKQMAEGMGGEISIASAGVGKGSTFTLELPLSDAR